MWLVLNLDFVPCNVSKIISNRISQVLIIFLCFQCDDYTCARNWWLLFFLRWNVHLSIGSNTLFKRIPSRVQGECLLGIIKSPLYRIWPFHLAEKSRVPYFKPVSVELVLSAASAESSEGNATKALKGNARAFIQKSGKSSREVAYISSSKS